jgi:hypothetical protein
MSAIMFGLAAIADSMLLSLLQRHGVPGEMTPENFPKVAKTHPALGDDSFGPGQCLGNKP